MLVVFLYFIVWAAVAGSRNEGGRPHFSSGVYDLTETILMTDSSEDPVGYKLVGTLTVDRVHDFLLLLKLDALQLQIMSRKAPTPLGFVEHASRLDELANDVQRPWLVKFSSFEPGTTHQRWNRVESIYVEPGEHLTIVNLKRGVTSLLQLSEEEGNTEEVDTSGLCSVSYLKDGNTIIKTKLNCTQPGNNKNNFLNDNVWGGRLNSRRETEATLGERGGFTEVTAEEWHSMSANLNPGLAVARLHVVSHLKLAEVKESTGQYGSSDVDSVVERLASGFKKYDLVINKEPSTCTHETCPTLAKLVSDSRKHLTATELGTAKSALAFIRLVRAIKSSTAEQIYAVINTAENKKILPQLMDVLGSAQCPSAHQAALKKLRINTGGKDFSLELAERYLWALSLSPNPTEAIVKDLIQIVKTGHKNEKLMYTLVLTLAATANKFAGVNSAFGQEIVQEVTLLIVEKLTACGDDQCRLVYLRSCSNFPAAIAQGGPIAEELVTTLLNHVVNSTQRCSVAALEALSKTEAWRHSQAVAQTCLRVYLSEGADTSARVLALDILLHQLMEDDGSRTERLRLATLLHPLSISTTPRELNQYLLQKIAQLSQLDSKGFGEAARATMLESGTWQWNVLATGGLSMAFERPVAPAASLSTSQEISNGVLKRGTVDVVLNHDTSRHSLFTLGLFSSGLSSFVSDSSSNNENEVVSAGLELRVAGVALRPFVFFNGQTELMGHVWSGTASSSTPAYQAIVMLGDTGTIEVVLGCGFIAELGITAAASVDLSGQIEISLWNRNAKSLVENSAGLAVVGIFKIESYLVKSQVEFNMITEPRLDLLSDLDFYNGVNLCLQLIQPQINLRLNSYKIERIGGSRHRLRKTRSSIVGPPVPARSYALNSKNNHMCSVIFGVPEDDTHT